MRNLIQSLKGSRRSSEPLQNTRQSKNRKRYYPSTTRQKKSSKNCMEIIPTIFVMTFSAPCEIGSILKPWWTHRKNVKNKVVTTVLIKVTTLIVTQTMIIVTTITTIFLRILVVVTKAQTIVTTVRTIRKFLKKCTACYRKIFTLTLQKMMAKL
ncbi:hypothetical protein D3C74_416350 [compost metagenome]